MSIKVSYTPNKQDLILAGYVGLRARPVVLVTGVLFFVVLPWLAALIFIAFGTISGTDGRVSILTLLLIPPILVAFFAYLPVHLFGKSPLLQGMHTLEFSENEIRRSGPGFDSHIQWATLTHCFEFAGGLQFYSNKLPLLVIPGRALTGTTLHALRTIITSKGIELRGAR